MSSFRRLDRLGRVDVRRVRMELLVGLVVAAAGIATPQSVSAKRNGSFAARASITRDSVVRIENRRGDVIIRKGTEDVVQVQGQIHDSTGEGDQAGRYTPAEIIAYLERKPPIEQSDKEVHIGAMLDEDFHLGVEIDYEIVVPAWVSLEIDAKHGRLEIQEVGERIEVDKDSGAVLILQPRGILAVKSGAGLLQILGTPRQEWSLESSFGGIDVWVPDNVGFELDAESKQGQLGSEFPLGEHKQGQLKGDINGGGPRIHIRSESGTVAIRRS